ncbi:MAG: hypothetical protein J5I53_05170 [Bradyrhizobiaceae bacterium]|nr:hypothetical protein [Bradyrhizobiaceae bacterium]
MYRFFTTCILGLCLLSTLSLAAPADTASWIQRANQGPETPKSAKWLQYTLDDSRLRVVLVIDSTDPGNYIYMVLYIPKYSGVGNYKLNSLTYYQYGNRSDQKTVCDYGSVNITKVDSATNVISATFDWGGTANLQNGISLKQKISSGVLSLLIKPEMLMISKPGADVKLKPEEDATFKIYARDKYITNRFFPGTTVTLEHDGTVFEGDKKLTGTTDNNGAATFNLKVKENAVTGDYTFKVKGVKENVYDSPELTVNFKVDASGRYYYSKCAGLPALEFDAGEGERWEEEGTNTIKSSGNKTRIAGLLSVDGVVIIDTTGSGAKITGSGKMYFDAVMFDGAVQPFNLMEGPFAFAIPPCENVLDLGTTELASALSGGKLKSAKLRFLGDGITSGGVEITCGMEIGKNAKEGCNDEVPFGTVWAPNKTAELELTLGITREAGVNNFSVSGTVKNFSPTASWCVKEVKVGYDSKKSELSLSGKGKSPFFEEIAAGVIFKEGVLNAFNVDFSLSTCIPVPETPLCWKGGGLSVENLYLGNPIKGKINAKFGPLSETAERLFELNIEGGFQDPPSQCYGKVTGNLIKVPEVSADKPFQVEVSGTGTADFTALTMTFEAEAKALHLGGEYFLNGKLTCALGFNPPSVSGSLEGSMTFQKMSDPNVQKLGMFGKYLNSFAPVTLGKASGNITLTEGGPNTISVTYDCSGAVAPTEGENPAMYKALRELGRGTLKVDLDALPNPSAIDMDGGFKTLLSGWFSQITKDGNATQAADVVFNVQDGQDVLVALIDSKTANLVSNLVDPDGTQITQSNPDGGIHQVYSPDGMMTLWVVKNPKPGEWKLAAPNATPADTFSVQAPLPLPTLELQSSIQDKNLVVSWTGTNLPQDAKLSFFLDQTAELNDGRFIGTATVKDNTATFALSDTTAPCSFTVMGVLADRAGNLTVHAPETLMNPAMTLMPPQGVQAVSNDAGNTTVSWLPIADGRVASVVIYDADADTVVVTAYNFETSTTVVLPGAGSRHLVARTVDKRGRISCPSEPVDILVSVNNDDPVVHAEMNGISSRIHPHPVANIATVDITGLDASPAVVQIIDVTGRVCTERLIMGSEAGSSTVQLGTEGLGNGMYILSIKQGMRTLSQGLIIAR